MRVAALITVICLAYSQQAGAWGSEGHRIVGRIAQTQLTPQTAGQIKTLLGEVDLAAIANWMDEERDAIGQRYPTALRWHFENREACHAPSPNACPNDQCLTKQLSRWLTRLADRSLEKAQRVDALKIVVHLVGDMHQPLHLIDHMDRGGNDVWVRIPKDAEPHRLHEAWDTTFVHENLRRRSIDRYARELLTRYASEATTWRSGYVESWATETHDLGEQFAYGPLPGFVCDQPLQTIQPLALSSAYVESARAVVEPQLVKAGLRLGLLLNRALDTESSSN